MPFLAVPRLFPDPFARLGVKESREAIREVENQVSDRIRWSSPSPPFSMKT